jgi:DNA-binding CsgD family transcriptional regulator
MSIWAPSDRRTYKEYVEGVVLLHITPHERAALQLLANGVETRRIADGLGVAEPEVEAHLNLLFARMGATSRAEAVAAAWRRGLLHSDAGVATL